MDDDRFDAVAKSLGRGAPRRAFVRLLAGNALGAVLVRLQVEDAAAACIAAGKRCERGDQCCAGSSCKGGTCKCKDGLTDCGKTCKACCVDGLRNGQESDIDCGGGCARCANGKACGGSNDCRSALCDTGLCRRCSSSNECGGDANGQCTCATTADTNEPVCRTSVNVSGVAACTECPRGTFCFREPQFGYYQCFEPCGAYAR